MGVSWLLLIHHTHCSYICAGHVAVLCCVLSRFRPVPAWAEGGRYPWCSAFKQRESNNKKQEGTHALDNHVYIHMYRRMCFSRCALHRKKGLWNACTLAKLYFPPFLCKILSIVPRLTPGQPGGTGSIVCMQMPCRTVEGQMVARACVLISTECCQGPCWTFAYIGIWKDEHIAPTQTHTHTQYAWFVAVVVSVPKVSLTPWSGWSC